MNCSSIYEELLPMQLYIYRYRYVYTYIYAQEETKEIKGYNKLKMLSLSMKNKQQISIYPSSWPPDSEENTDYVPCIYNTRNGQLGGLAGK